VLCVAAEGEPAGRLVRTEKRENIRFEREEGVSPRKKGKKNVKKRGGCVEDVLIRGII